MKKLDRLSLIDRIGRALQARMSYGDIDAYLTAFGVDTSKPTSGVNSKWVYTKELLSSASDDTVVKIADELELPHSHVVTPARDVLESSFWEPLHLRLFLCHLSSFKMKAAALQRSLQRFGISAFVAHVDIEPTTEWQDEIEAALYSMDALAAILIPGFKESNWTDQEVGVAVGRGALVIPIIRGLDPYGFIAKYQGLQATGKTVPQVANEVFQILATSPKTRAKMLSCWVDTTLRSASQDEALARLSHLSSIKSLPLTYLERLRDGAAGASVFTQGETLDRLNELLTGRGLSSLGPSMIPGSTIEGDIPF